MSANVPRLLRLFDVYNVKPAPLPPLIYIDTFHFQFKMNAQDAVLGFTLCTVLK